MGKERREKSPNKLKERKRGKERKENREAVVLKIAPSRRSLFLSQKSPRPRQSKRSFPFPSPAFRPRSCLLRLPCPADCLLLAPLCEPGGLRAQRPLRLATDAAVTAFPQSGRCCILPRYDAEAAHPAAGPPHSILRFPSPRRRTESSTFSKAHDQRASKQASAASIAGAGANGASAQPYRWELASTTRAINIHPSKKKLSHHSATRLSRYYNPQRH